MAIHKRARVVLVVILTTLTVIATIATFASIFSSSPPPSLLSWSEFLQAIDKDKLRQVTVQDDGAVYQLVGTLKTGHGQFITRIPRSAMDANGWHDFSGHASAHGTTVEFRSSYRLARFLVPGLAGLTAILVLATVGAILLLRQDNKRKPPRLPVL